jgi:hypothetical protein
MASRMVTIRLEDAHANLKQVMERYGLAPEEVDEGFGVVCVSPEQQLYAIVVDDEAAARIEGQHDIAGVFANPKIKPFGPSNLG